MFQGGFRAAVGAPAGEVLRGGSGGCEDYAAGGGAEGWEGGGDLEYCERD